MASDELENGGESADDVGPARARLIRRVGYVVFGIATAYISVPMLIGAVGGYVDGDIRDPYTHMQLSEQVGAERVCIAEAQELLVGAGELQRIDRKWDIQARKWFSKCKEDFPELYQVLLETRTQLRHPDESQ